MTTQKIFYVSYGQRRLLIIDILITYIIPSTMLFQGPHNAQFATTSTFLIIVSLCHWRWLERKSKRL